MEKYEYKDTVIFKIGAEEIKYVVNKSFLHSYNDILENDYIFKRLNITNKEKFCKAAYGYVPIDSIFPECKRDDYDALNRVIEALQKECDEYNKKHSALYKNGYTISEKETTVLRPKFKIGDKVRILPRNGNADDYPGMYVDLMQSYAGTECIIEKIEVANEINKKRKYYEEPYSYIVNTNSYIWSSASLQLVSESTNLKDTNYTEVKQIKSINTNEKETVLTINKNKKTF